MAEIFEEIVCRIHEDIQCSKSVEIIDGELIRFLSRESTRLIAETDKNSMLLCNGIDFQVHVWGSNKYVIWSLEKGVTKCIVLRNLYLDKCNEALHVVSSEPYSCSKLDTLVQCEEKALRIYAERGVPLFIALDITNPRLRELENVLIHGDQGDCWTKILLLEHKKQISQRP